MKRKELLKVTWIILTVMVVVSMLLMMVALGS
jgi:hypothetical protein